MTTPPQVARKVHLETERYILRTVEASDATIAIGQWPQDPNVAHWLNARPRTASLVAVKNFIATFDGKVSHLIGIFERSSERLIGFYEMHIDWPRREYQFNVLIGEASARNQGARTETRVAIHQFFMEELDLRASLATVVAGHPNLPALKRWGWVIESKSIKPSATGGAPVVLIHMRLTRKGWHRSIRKE